RTSAAAASFVHYGATSQDVIDTALVLQLREVSARLDAELRGLIAALAKLARAEADTPMAARTWMQHALPTTFGFKIAGWLDGVRGPRGRMVACRESGIVLKLGGAFGTLAALGAQGPAVAKALGDELGLPLPAIAWHSMRDRAAEVASAMGLLAAT